MILQVSLEEQARLEAIIHRFRERWHADFSGPLTADYFTEFLPSDSLRRAVLFEIVAIDLLTRLAHGERVRLSDYLRLIGDLGDAETLPARLLYIEFTALQHSQQPIPLDDYVASYPTQAAELRTLIETRSLASENKTSGTLVINPEQDDLEILPIQATSTHIPQHDEKLLKSTTAGSDGNLAETIGESWNARSTERFINLGGGYRMIRQIGKGNYGEVWLSEAPGGVEVALKVVDIPAGQRLKDLEVRSLDLMKRLRHPFLLQVQAFWVSEEQIHIAMELADESLRDCARAAAGKVIPVEDLMQHMREAAEGIDYLHRQKVVHRDIKPENLLMLKRHIKVADFGLARFMDESGLKATATQVAGSPLYMAPEVWAGKPEASSDQYSLAVTYAELRAGKAPFKSTNMVDVMKEHLYGEPDLSPFEQAEQAILKTALSKHPGDRFSSCTEFVQALVAATAAPQAAEKRPPVLSRQALVGFSVLALLLVTAGAALVYQYWPTGLRSRSDGPEVAFREEVSLAYGEQIALEISGSDKSDAPQNVVFSDPPAGVSLQFNAATTAIELAADLDAPLGVHEVAVTVSTPRGEVTKPLMIAVVDSTRLRMPNRARPADNSTRIDLDGKIYFDRIEILLPSNEEIGLTFRLIPRKATSDPPTFYIMTLEVTNQAFAEFARANPHQIGASGQWKRGALAGTEFLGVKGESAALPVVYVTAEEAHAFAAWIGGLLPSSDQWDKAAGAREEDRSSGPYRAGEAICVDRFDRGPVAAGTSGDDVSMFGVMDLAGSVTEFTRNILGTSLVVPLTDSIDTDRVILRGNSYHDPGPWKFDQTQDSIPPSLPYFEAKPEVGFRVVLELL